MALYIFRRVGMAALLALCVAFYAWVIYAGVTGIGSPPAH